MIGLGVLGLLTSAGMFGAVAYMSTRFDDDENPGPRAREDEDTQPWPAPR